ncbi:type II toxin-antitoxin system ParD family antitoxin [Rhodobacteraceae bacterium M385]|nr:type II toxin-antitoxin system ParD family antitoxin [Rhodobacteraceae bacterium M385]
MARNTSVSLGDHFGEFIDEKVKEGRYGSASDVIRAGLRLLEEEETKLTLLRAEIDKGDASGIAEGFDWDTFLADMNAKHGQ